MNLPTRIKTDYCRRAASERSAGSTIKINYTLPYVDVTMSDGSEYFFQGDEASELLAEVPVNIDPESYILALAQGW